MNRDDLLGSDDALDQALGTLGAPPAAAPKATAAAIVAGAGLAAPAVAAGLATWKVATLVALGTTLGLGGGYLLRGGATALPAEPVYDEAALVEFCADLEPASTGDDDRETVAALAPTSETSGPADPDPSANPRTPRGTTSNRTVTDPADRGAAGADADAAATGPRIIYVREDCPDPKDESWIPEPEPYEPARPWPPPAPEGGEPADDATAGVEGSWRRAGERRGPLAHLRLGGGLVTHLGTWEELAPPAGPDVRLELMLKGHGAAPIQPVAMVGLHGAALLGSEHVPTRFVVGLHLGGGVAFGGPHTRLELAWSFGGHWMPGLGDDIEGEDDPIELGGARTLLTTGPQLGLALTPRSGPALHVAATIHGSALRIEDDDTREVQPWLGLTVGVELPPVGAGNNE